MKNTLRKFFLSFFIFLILALLIIVYLSPKETAPFLDVSGNVIENSISEISEIEINGVKQRIIIRGKDKSNPILLHLHGGPGGPDRPLIKDKTLEDFFTVCYWDQRGAGASYDADIDVETMNQDQIIKDGLELAKHLIKKYGKEKVFLEAHSWGTLFGIQMIYRNPELFHAYFGVAQCSNSILSEQFSYDFVYSSAKGNKDDNTLKILNEIGRPPYKTDEEWVDKLKIERRLLKKYQFTNPKTIINTFNIYKDFIFYREYSVSDKLNALKGSSFSLKLLWPEAKRTNLNINFTNFKVPIYFFHGKQDMTTVTSVTKEYFESITAPKKMFYTFDNSAHWPHLSEYEKYKSIIKSIVNK
jgi:pimeloyl-ACP methyl ester carboxylesterase